MSSHEKLVGRYELRGVLGCGGMAEVRDGWDSRLNRAVAVKLLHPALNTQPDVRRRFEDEARSAAALSHPNIVSVYDCGDDDGRPFIVMERLPGDTLHDHIGQGPLPVHRVRAVLNDVLGALVVAHAAGVLHRDIKPGNILVASDGATMKVADFGIAKTAGSALTMTGQIIGTMAYMSPERIAGASASVADDLYALGVIGYEALTGRFAFPQDNPAVLAHAIMQAPLPSVAAERPDVDPVLAGVIDKAIARDARQRFASADQMRDALHGDRAAFHTGALPAMAPPAPRPATKVLDQPLPVAGPGTFVSPDADYYVPAKRRAPLSRNKKMLAAAGVFVAFVVAVLALATDPSSTTEVTEPIGTSTPVSTPRVAPPPAPPPVATPVLQPEKPKDEKKDDEKKDEEGGGNGNEGNRGRGD
ncbi:MAG: serine/threonine protein kinase [Mycobacteriaceae bacterium]|nr:serine/threonine protein kinase [Mycobacteriaceae bacterium]